jgi:hypothetical protein
MRVMVCGGTGFTDDARLHSMLDRMHASRAITTLIHAGAAGAETVAAGWARARNIPVVLLAHLHDPASWPDLRRRIAACGAHGLIALPGGVATEQTCRVADAVGIPVWKPFG